MPRFLIPLCLLGALLFSLLWGWLSGDTPPELAGRLAFILLVHLVGLGALRRRLQHRDAP